MSRVTQASVQVLLLVLALAIAASFAWAAGDWSAAQSKVEELKTQQKALRELSADEMRRLVAAVCEVDENERSQVEAADDLNAELAKVARAEGSQVLRDLLKTNAAFAKCKDFRPKLKCYTLCPPVNDDSEWTEPSVSWSDCS